MAERAFRNGVRRTHFLVAVAFIVCLQVYLFAHSTLHLTSTTGWIDGHDNALLSPMRIRQEQRPEEARIHKSSGPKPSATTYDVSKQQDTGHAEGVSKGRIKNKQQDDNNDDGGGIVGTFNGFNMRYREGPIHSSVHCVGSNFESKDGMRLAWMYRSCRFQHFCFDLDKRDFVLFRSKEERALIELSRNDTFFEPSSTMTNTSVSLGGINNKWNFVKKGVHRLEWFPEVREGDLTEGYYVLDDDVVWTPFHSLAGFNPGHLVWDDFLPVYTLLRIFRLLEGHRVLMMQQLLEKGSNQQEGLWATCQYTEELATNCKQMMTKFLPLMGFVMDKNFTTNRNVLLNLTSAAPQSKLVCARHGAAGIGMLTDHGLKQHGWAPSDYVTMHNHGRGSMLLDFRDHMLSNIGIPTKSVVTKPPYLVIFSVGSSETWERSATFETQQEVLRMAFGNQLEIYAFEMQDLALDQQVEVATESAIFVTVCGGGAVTATFLPPGSSLLVYYQTTGGIVHGIDNGLPARLDWDLINNAAHIRSHWLPLETMNSTHDHDLLVKLVAHELDIIAHGEY